MITTTTETTTQAETLLDYLRDALEHAPLDPGKMAKTLKGWHFEDCGVYICARCGGRILARGCSINYSVPVWVDTDKPWGACDLCGN
jgi:hypothetical protein